MLRFRARTAAATIAAVATIVLTVGGQAPSVRPLEIQDVGLPAIQEGVVWDVNRAPQMPQVLDRAALARQGSVVGASGRAYTPGRVIVRFRDGLSFDERRSIVRLATEAGEIMPRPEHVDFDLVSIDEAADAEAVAGAFAARPDVVYAQASYRLY